VGRADVLAGVFFLLAFICYAKARESGGSSLVFLAGCVGCGAAAMLSKETGLMVFPVCVAWDILVAALGQKGRDYDGRGGALFTRIVIVAGSMVALLTARMAINSGMVRA
jgi:4-amino-4-deoxy-L-arabinose transferase-like glycosyltransferase